MVGNITNLSDARYCAGMGVDWLGFPATLDTKLYKEITGWVTGPEFVLEVNKETPQITESFAAEIIQLPWTRLNDFGKTARLLVVVPINQLAEALPQLMQYRNHIEQLIISEVNEKSDLTQTKNNGFHMLVDLETSSIPLDSILALPVDGLVIRGSQELKPGLHDYSKLSEVLEQLEVE